MNDKSNSGVYINGLELSPKARGCGFESRHTTDPDLLFTGLSKQHKSTEGAAPFFGVKLPDRSINMAVNANYLPKESCDSTFE